MIKRGDIIALDGHRLMCGDSTNPNEVAELLDGATPNVMVANPPYVDNLAVPEPREPALRRYGRHASWQSAYELFPGDVAYVWGTGGPHAVVYFAALEAAGFEVRHGIVWDKGRPLMNRGKHAYAHKLGWFAVRKGATMSWVGPAMISTVWREPPVEGAEKLPHPHQKPVALYERALAVHAGDLYDPFGGSGTGLIAAERLKRRSFTMELEPEYCELIVSRYEEETNKAQLELPIP